SDTGPNERVGEHRAERADAAEGHPALHDSPLAGLADPRHAHLTGVAIGQGIRGHGFGTQPGARAKGTPVACAPDWVVNSPLRHSLSGIPVGIAPAPSTTSRGWQTQPGSACLPGPCAPAYRPVAAGT